MDGFVFVAAMLATLLIVTVFGIGRHLNRVQEETGVPSKWSDVLLFGGAGLFLAGFYFMDAHPLIGHTVAIITGFAACSGFLLVGGLLVRVLRQGLQKSPPHRQQPSSQAQRD